MFHWNLGAKKTGAEWPPFLENVRQLFGGFLQPDSIMILHKLIANALDPF